MNPHDDGLPPRNDPPDALDPSPERIAEMGRTALLSIGSVKMLVSERREPIRP